MIELESLVRYADDFLGLPGHPDYRTALNGLQVAGRADHPVARIAAAVDASEAVVDDAISRGADLLVVHHGLFWDGLRPVTGRRYRKLSQLLEAGLAVYSAHLPLDAHPEVGNCALLARALDLGIEGGFGRYEGITIGWRGAFDAPLAPETLEARVAKVVGGPARILGSGPGEIRTAAVVTGGGGNFVAEAAEAGVDALVTGEGAHHTFVDAHELGIHVVLAGHYATETFGVKALSGHLAERFDLSWEFLDHPSGL